MPFALRIAGHGSLFIVCILLCALGGAALGAVAGSLIGDFIGDPEGEGFIGFLYGLRIGGALGGFGGLAIYCVLALLFEARLTARG